MYQLFTIFLFLFFSPLTTTSVSDNHQLVIDIDGKPVQSNTNYYILPVMRGNGGGLTLDSRNTTQLCPLYVSQQNQEVSNGLPLKFLPVNPKHKTISVSSDLNMVFDAASICVQSNVWSLIKDDQGSERRYVGAGGQVGNPGIGTLSNWFRIDKAGSGEYDYKIVYCPGVCDVCRVACGDIGVFIEKDGRRLLGVNRDKPLLVMFKKA